MKMGTVLSCILLVGVMLLSACTGGGSSGGNLSTNATITDGVMTTSVDQGSKPTGGIKTSFPLDAPVLYVSFKVSGVAKEDMIKATWVYVGGAAADKANTVLNETYDIVEAPEASYYLAFYFDKPPEGWNKGDYKVVLSINNKEKLSVPFRIE